MRTCKKCGKEKTIESFPLNGGRTCHPCRYLIYREKGREYSVRNHAKILDTRRKYWLSETGKASLKKSNDKRNSIARTQICKRIAVGMRLKLSGSKFGNNWQKLVGYDEFALKAHLESLFKPGMTWGNLKCWEIDHIVPISSFNFSSESDPDFKKCWELSNLQPLWPIENLKKGKKCKLI